MKLSDGLTIGIALVALAFTGATFFYTFHYKSEEGSVVISSANGDTLHGTGNYRLSLFISNSGDVDLTVRTITLYVQGALEIKKPIDFACRLFSISVDNTQTDVASGSVVPVDMHTDLDTRCFWQYLQKEPHRKNTEGKQTFFNHFNDNTGCMTNEVSSWYFNSFFEVRKFNLALLVRGAYGTGREFSKEIPLSEFYLGMEESESDMTGEHFIACEKSKSPSTPVKL